MKQEQLNTNSFIQKESFFLIAGPCIIENADLAEEIAEKLKKICSDLDILLIYKASYRKANRTKADSFKGIGDDTALDIIGQIRQKYNVAVLTDIHESYEAQKAASYVDILQIPAFLCRQTSLLEAAGNTGKIVNIKKGQFVSAQTMAYAVEKVRATGNNNVMLTERGSQFGYNDLIVDFRNIPLMKKNNVPVVMDITHALQQPNSSTGVTGGQPEMIETIAKAAIAAGTDGIFLETHPNPEKALSDGKNMIPLNKIPVLLEKLKNLKKAV